MAGESEGILMGGGPSAAQNNAANAQAGLASQQGAAAQQALKFMQDQQAKVNPFYTSRMQNGLPYMNALTDAQGGLTAQAFQPARAQLMRQLGSQQGLPNGFRDQAMTDFNENQSQAFDQNLMGALGANEQAKQAGASGLLGQAQLANPQSFFQGATGANQSILQAPLQKPGMAGILGGVAGGLASAIPF
jgi:hypothetical protein